jgi:Ham1 family
MPADRHQELMGGNVDVITSSMRFCDFYFYFYYSYAEMDTKQKNAISHRGRALEKLRAYLQQEAQGVASASAA